MQSSLNLLTGGGGDIAMFAYMYANTGRMHGIVELA